MKLRLLSLVAQYVQLIVFENFPVLTLNNLEN